MELIQVEDIKQYLRDGILKGAITPFYVKHVVKVQARQGKVGEIINTFSLEGDYSTTKTVFRTTNNEIDWVLTHEDGDCIVVDDQAFKDNYEETNVKGEYISKDNENLVLPINENIEFRNQHGNKYRVLAGHYILAKTADDFHELTPKNLDEHYEILKKKYEFEKDNIFFEN